MELVINLWILWMIGMLACGAYAVINHLDRIASILGKINLNLQDIMPLFFNGRKFTRFIIAAFITFGFSVLFCVSLFVSVMRAIRLEVKLF
jgi:hypothetical protein